MDNDKYVVTGKCIDGLNLVGFLVKRGDKPEKLISYADTVTFAKQGKVSNAEAILDTVDSEYKVVIKDGLEQLKTVYKQGQNKVVPVSRMVSAEKKQCVGYTVRDNQDNTYKMTADKFWSLASVGEVDGVKGIISDGRKVLISENNLLAELPKMLV